DRKVPENAVADHDRLIPGIDADVHVQAESDQTSGHVLEKLHEVHVAVVGRNLLFRPVGEWVRRSPKQLAATAGGQILHQPKFASKILTHLVDAFAHVRVNLQVALHQLRLDLFLQVGGDAGQDLLNPAAELHGVGVDQ